MKNLFVVILLGIYPFYINAQANRDCRAMPPFTAKIGFDITRSYFSTSERRTIGFVYVELPKKEGDAPRTWQHPTWKNAGWLGPMLMTEKGEVWVAPIPVVNLLHNKPEEQNFLWKIDGQTGEMKVALELPRPDSAFTGQNPFGILGLGYDCGTGVIYISSVAGSTLDHEMGKVYAVRSSDLKILDQIDSIDVCGLGVGTVNGVKKLYFGRARNCAVQAVDLRPDGTFENRPATVLTLDDLGPRGDDRARKIRFEPDGTMVVQGVEFFFNLTAPTEKQETLYRFKYLPNQQKWQLQ